MPQIGNGLAIVSWQLLHNLSQNYYAHRNVIPHIPGTAS